jgi:hypothetical protein
MEQDSVAVGDRETLLAHRSELRQASFDLRYRKLDEASRWAMTQLQGMKAVEGGVEELPVALQHRFMSQGTMDVEISDAYDMAVSYFQSRVRDVLFCFVLCGQWCMDRMRTTWCLSVFRNTAQLCLCWKNT